MLSLPSKTSKSTKKLQLVKKGQEGLERFVEIKYAEDAIGFLE